MFAFPLQDFLARFPEFSDTAKYTLVAVQNAGDRAMMHIQPEADGMPMRGPCRHYALMLMAAHLLELEDATDENGTQLAGAPYKANIGSVQIENSKQNSFTNDDWNFWLGQTKHGRELLAFLDVQAPTGVYGADFTGGVRDLV